VSLRRTGAATASAIEIEVDRRSTGAANEPGVRQATRPIRFVVESDAGISGDGSLVDELIGSALVANEESDAVCGRAAGNGAEVVYGGEGGAVAQNARSPSPDGPIIQEAIDECIGCDAGAVYVVGANDPVVRERADSAEVVEAVGVAENVSAVEERAHRTIKERASSAGARGTDLPFVVEGPDSVVDLYAGVTIAPYDSGVAERADMTAHVHSEIGPGHPTVVGERSNTRTRLEMERVVS